MTPSVNPHSAEGRVWQPIATAPKDGTQFIGRVRWADRQTGKMRYMRRLTHWDAKHSEAHGWATGGCMYWQPQDWKPKP